ncbi:MAG: hypothetical protein CSA22_06080 [Deltaproteobacteria bacterium]|nr:MAG: hypothetical protein CSA22_06080 [Deltaproteobacteria bacterium]
MSSSFRIVRPICVAVSLLLVMSAGSFAAETGTASAASDDWVAIVNDTPIYAADVAWGVAQVTASFEKTGRKMGDDEKKRIRERLIKELIDMELLIQASAKKGVQVTDAEVSAKIEAYKARYPDAASFEAALKAQNLSMDNLRKQTVKMLTVERFVKDELSKQVSISQADAEAFYKAHPERYTQKEQVRASHILVKVESSAPDETRAAARKKLEGIQERLKKGEDFSALAKESSDCPSSASGGDLGFFERGRMVKPFSDAAFAMKKNEVSDIVETRFGYHLIQLTDRKAASVMPFDQVRETLMKELKEQEIRKALTAYLKHLNDTAEIVRR